MKLPHWAPQKQLTCRKCCKLQVSVLHCLRWRQGPSRMLPLIMNAQNRGIFGGCGIPQVSWWFGLLYLSAQVIPSDPYSVQKRLHAAIAKAVIARVKTHWPTAGVLLQQLSGHPLLQRSTQSIRGTHVVTFEIGHRLQMGSLIHSLVRAIQTSYKNEQNSKPDLFFDGLWYQMNLCWPHFSPSRFMDRSGGVAVALDTCEPEAEISRPETR